MGLPIMDILHDGIVQYGPFLTWHHIFQVPLWHSIPSVPLHGWVTLHCMDVPQFAHPFIRARACWWCPSSGFYEEYHFEYLWTSFCLCTCNPWRWAATGLHDNSRFTLGSSKWFSTAAVPFWIPISSVQGSHFSAGSPAHFFLKSQPSQGIQSGVTHTFFWSSMNIPYSSAW